MTTIVPLAKIEKDGLCIVPEIGMGLITLRLSGSCDSQTLSVLDRFLRHLHDEAVRRGARTIALDCESLYFMNSSAIKAFVTWLTKVKALPPAERYEVRVRTNRRLDWQHRSFSAIARSAPEVFRIEKLDGGLPGPPG